MKTTFHYHYALNDIVTRDAAIHVSVKILPISNITSAATIQSILNLRHSFAVSCVPAGFSLGAFYTFCPSS